MALKVITAVEPLVYESPSVFLGGGILNCPPWADEVIKELADTNCVAYNPRRKDFDINDPSVEQEQIEWEFTALAIADIFSMWFCNASSDQPICLYELGRHLTIRQRNNDLDSVVIGVEPGYKRERDVYIQTALVDKSITISSSLKDHILAIKKVIASKNNAIQLNSVKQKDRIWKDLLQELRNNEYNQTPEWKEKVDHFIRSY